MKNNNEFKRFNCKITNKAEGIFNRNYQNTVNETVTHS